jgi:hypothetical protein
MIVRQKHLGTDARKIDDIGLNRVVCGAVIAISVAGGMLTACSQEKISPAEYSNFMVITSEGDLNQEEFYKRSICRLCNISDEQ